MLDEYRMGVGIFLLNKENKLWVGKRIDFKTNFWQMPQGGIDNHESPREAMIRELGEEVGIKKNFEIIEESKSWLKYQLPQEIKKKFGMENILDRSKNGLFVNFLEMMTKLI